MLFRSAKLAGRNTLDYTAADGVRRVRLHQTDVLTFRPDGSFTVCTGGFNTPTTRDRINSFLPPGFTVWTSKGVIHLSERASDRPAVPFLESITVDAAGQVQSDATGADLKATGALLDSFMRKVKARGLPSQEDSKGDPWVLPGPRKVAESIMRDWLESGYFTRTFYGLALEHAGMTPQSVAYSMRWTDDRGGKLDARDLGRVRRYARQCLGLG